MYVDASDSCNTAAFQLGQAAIGTTLATRTWNIKVGSSGPVLITIKTFFFDLPNQYFHVIDYRLYENENL